MSPETTLLMCPYCAEPFASQSLLGRHVQSKHPERTRKGKRVVLNISPGGLLSLVNQFKSTLEDLQDATIPEEMRDRASALEARQRLVILYNACMILQDVSALIAKRSEIQDVLIEQLKPERLRECSSSELISWMQRIDLDVQRNMQAAMEMLGLRRKASEELMGQLSNFIESLRSRINAKPEADARSLGIPEDRRQREDMRQLVARFVAEGEVDGQVDVEELKRQMADMLEQGEEAEEEGEEDEPEGDEPDVDAGEGENADDA